MLSDGDLTGLCQELQAELITGTVRGEIPALSDTKLVAVGDPSTDYLLGTDRVIGIEITGEYIAIPHNIPWWHEIANFNDLGLAVTYFPLAGSSMVFDRRAAVGAEFGVSGLLFNHNLVMVDRSSSDVTETLWPQMLATGRCGLGEGRGLDMVAALEIEWEDWVALHPDTRVLSEDTGLSRPCTLYPYGDYEIERNAFTLFPQGALDPRRPPKERVFRIPDEDRRAISFLFSALRNVGDFAVAHETLDDGQGGTGGRIVVFWDSDASVAMAYRLSAGGQNMTFEVRNGTFVDLETGTEWSLKGKALSSPLASQRLEMIPEAFISFWFAFSTFFGTPALWRP